MNPTHLLAARTMNRLVIAGVPQWRARWLRHHAARCNACGARLDRLLLAARLLENDDPAVPSAAELRLLQAARPFPARGPASAARSARWWLSGAVAGAAALVLAVVAVKPDRDEWTARGGPTSQLRLRVFCATGPGLIAELTDGGACASTGTLAFSAASPASGFVAVSLKGSFGEVIAGPVQVAGTGTDQPLEATVAASGLRGQVQVRGAFASTADAAVKALGTRSAGDGPVVEREIRIEEGQ